VYLAVKSIFERFVKTDEEEDDEHQSGPGER